MRPRRAAGAIPAAAVLALALAPPRHARADRYEATIAIRPTWGLARIWDDGTARSAMVQGRGVATSVNLGIRNWLDLGSEIVLGSFDKASYASATLPISANPRSGPLERRSSTGQLRCTATLRSGVRWVWIVQLALGMGLRYRTTALLNAPTAQGERWLIPDDQREEVALDLVTGARAGLERRVSIHWTAGVSAAVAHSFGILRPDLQTSDVTLSLAYSWYPNLGL